MSEQDDIKMLAQMCAQRVVRLIELDAPTHILKVELEMLQKRCEALPPRVMSGKPFDA